MTIPAWLFSTALWAALVVVGAAAVFLLVMLVREWKDGSLW
jgi:hypothetical protein